MKNKVVSLTRQNVTDICKEITGPVSFVTDKIDGEVVIDVKLKRAYIKPKHIKVSGEQLFAVNLEIRDKMVIVFPDINERKYLNTNQEEDVVNIISKIFKDENEEKGKFVLISYSHS